MAHRVKKHYNILRVLKNGNPRLRQAILSSMDDDCVRCLCDCALNVLNYNIKLSPTQKKRLIQYKRSVRRLARKSPSLPKKRSILVQNGGMLPALVAPILAVAATLLDDQAGKLAHTQRSKKVQPKLVRWQPPTNQGTRKRAQSRAISGIRLGRSAFTQRRRQR